MDFNSNPELIEQSGVPEACISKGRLVREGWRAVRAFIEPSGPAPTTKNENPEARPDAERKADQRQRQLADGLKLINVVVPKDDDNRTLVMQAAKAIKSKAVSRDVAAALTDRDLVKIARRLRRLRGSAADEVGCGYAFDHPAFQRVIDPILSQLIEPLAGDMTRVCRTAEGPIAMEARPIARTRYTIEATTKRDSVGFDVNGLAVFEKRDRTVIEAIRIFLEERLHLHLLPIGSKQNAH